MIRVLVAEDELPLLRGIKAMIEGLDPEFTVVKSAKNGREALEYLKEQPVQVVFTDIHMPMVDGTEILKYVYESCPLTSAVVISGYRDFSYARKALLYNAKNYLLKPVDREELALLLAQIKDELRQRAGEEKNRILTGILYEGTSCETGNALFETVYPMYLMAGAFNPNNLEEMAPGNVYWKNHDLKQIVSLVTGLKKGIFCFFGKAMNEQILFMEGLKEPDMAGIAEGILAMLPPRIAITVCYGKAITDISQVQEVLGTLRTEIKEKCRFGISSVTNALPERRPFTLGASTESAISYAIRKADFAELKGILFNVRDRMKLFRVTQAELERILQKLFLMAAAHSVERNEFEESNTFLDVAELLSNAADMDQVFEEFLQYVKDMNMEKTSEEGKDLMREVDEYILAHMEEQITTKMLATRFGLVSPYLSRLFKAYKGLTPSQYIQNIRLNNAKELLITYPNITSKDIAGMVGYQDPLYFSKIFKKNTGVYPSEYRAMYQKEK